MADEINLSQESIEALARELNRNSRSATRPSSSSSSGGSSGGSTRSFGQQRAEFEGVLGDLTGVVSRAGGSVTEFSQDVTNLAGRLPVLGGALEFFGGTVTSLVDYLEVSQRTFQSLSKVGAGFNGDLGALRAAAANTRMPLDQFANLVGRNSTALAGLGAGVNDGARRFSELSRAMFEDGQVIRGMTNLGYTLEEANEFLLDNASLLRRQAMMDGMNDQQIAQATLAMAENIAFMAEITGESADQQRQELLDAQRDGRNIAALRRLEAQGLEGVQESFSTAFNGLQAAGPAAQAFLQDMLQTGAPMSELTQNFAAMNPQVAEQIRQMAATIKSNEDAETKRQRVQAQANRAIEVSASEYVSATNLAVAATGQVNSTAQSQADLLAETENFRLGVEQTRRQMAEERGFTGGGFGNVTQAEAAERFLVETRNRVQTQSGGGGEGQAISRELNLATIALADSAAGVNQEIASNLSANTDLQRSVTQGLRGISDIAAGMGQVGESAVRAFTPGDVDQDRINENNFRQLFEPLITTNALRTEVTNLPEILESFSNLSGDQLEVLMEQFRADREGRFMGGPVRSGTSYTVGEKGPETFVPGVDGSIVPNMDQAVSSVQNAVQTIMPNMRAEASSMQSSMMQMATNLRSRMESTSDGKFDTETFTAELRGAMSNNPDISTQRIEQLLDTLNQSMLQLVSINNNMSQNGKRTVDALRGSSGNLMQGIRSR